MPDRCPLHARVIGTVYRRVDAVARPFMHEPHAPPADGFAVRELGGGDAAAHLRLRPDQGEARVRARLAAGRRCFGVWAGDQLVHVAWIATTKVTIDCLGAQMQPLPGDLHIFDPYTRPDFRRRGCTVMRAAQVRSLFLGGGFQRSLGAVARVDRMAWTTAAARGHGPIGTYTAFRLGPRWHLCRGPSPGPRRGRGSSRPARPLAMPGDMTCCTCRQTHIRPRIGYIVRRPNWRG